MDPYIEGTCWGDFHSVFIQCWCEALLDLLPNGFDAEITEYVSSGVAVPEYVERPKWPFIEIKRLDVERVIAVLELLSPSNKSGDDRIEYLRTRESVFRSDAHLVELDLLQP